MERCGRYPGANEPPPPPPPCPPPVSPACQARLNTLYGNPYFSPMREPAPCDLLYNEFGRTGYRRTLVQYPNFVDAKGGNIIVSELDSHRLQFFDVTGQECRFSPFGSRGHAENQFEYPGGVTTTSERHAAVVVADTGNQRVCLYRAHADQQGYGVLHQTHTFGHQIFKEPLGVEYDIERDKLFVVDATTRRVSTHDLRTGVCVGEFRQPRECPLVCPVDVAVDQRDGTCYVTDARGNCIQVYERNGDFIGHFGKTGSGPGEFSKPWGCCFDRQFNLLISDELNNRVVMHASLDKTGIAAPYVKVVTTDVYRPKGVSINVHENLVVADGSAHNFLKIIKFK